MGDSNASAKNAGLTNDQVNAGIQYVKRNASTISQADMRVWELCIDVPAMTVVKAYGCAGLNVIVAGGGTVLSAFLGDKNLNKTQLVVGLIQFLTSAWIIGYLLSIYWGYKLVMAAGRNKNKPTASSAQAYNPYG
jgi:hypothetical protein